MDLPFPASINKNGKHKDLARGLEQPMKHIFLNPGSSKAITSELKAAVGYSMDKFKGQGAVPKFSPDVLPSSHFSYTPLQGPSRIRLLRIDDVDETGLLRCSLEEHDHADATPPYAALSYVWTDYGNFERGRAFSEQPADANVSVPRFHHDDATSIVLDGCRFDVGANLYEALRGLRPHLDGRLLWADAICINQTDDAEKTVQVSRMGSIYTQASNVLVWLGRRLPVRKAGLDVIRSWPDFPTSASDSGAESSSSASPIRYGGRTYASPKHFFDATAATADFVSWLSLFRAATEGWFSRVWTLQEFVLARDVAFFYDGDRVPTADLDKAIRWTYFIAGDMPPAIMPPWTMFQPSLFDLRRRFAQGRALDLLDAAILGATRIATDPRDKLYGLLSIVDPAELGHPALTPDYANKDLGQFYVQLASSLLRGKAGLLTLSLVNHPSLPKGSSNVKDFFGSIEGIGTRLFNNYRAKRRLKPPPDDPNKRAPNEAVSIRDLQPDWDGTNTHSFPSWVPKLAATLNTPPLFLRELRAQKALGSALHDPSWRIFHACSSPSGNQSSSPLSQDSKVLTVYVYPFDTIRHVVSLPQTPTAHPAFWNSIRAWWSSKTRLADTIYLPDPSAPLPAALWRTLLANIWLTNHPAPAACAGYFASFVSRALGGQQRTVRKDLGIKETPRPEEGEIFAAALDVAGLGRALFIGQGGYLGLGPPRAQEGDTVVLVQGAHVPFVMRKTNTGRWLLIGEAYVHGVMYGELMSKANFQAADIM